MQIAPLVSKHISEVVHGNWTEIYLDDATADITFAEAVALPPGITNSIAMLMHHIGFYNAVVMEWLKGNTTFVDASNGFGVTIHTEDDWQQLRQNVLDSFKTLANAAKDLSNEKLAEFAPAKDDTLYKTLHGTTEHAHYHLGQIVLIKQIIRAAK